MTNRVCAIHAGSRGWGARRWSHAPELWMWNRQKHQTLRNDCCHELGWAKFDAITRRRGAHHMA